MNNIAVLFACIVTVSCNDIQVGSNYGRKIFDQNIEASPAIWRQSQKITINATNSEIISSIVVTDQRPEKDGDAKIIEGGEGHKNVTIELQSPTVFRGFDFHVIVYAVEEGINSAPVMTKDTDVNLNGKPEDKNNVDNVTTTLPEHERKSDDKLNAPAITGDKSLLYSSVQAEVADPIVQYVEKTTESEELSSSSKNEFEVSTDNAFNKDIAISHPVPFGADKSNVSSTHKRHLNVSQISGVFEEKDSVTPRDLSTSSTTLGSDDVTSSTTTESAHDVTTQNLEGISKDLEGKVVATKNSGL